MRRRVVITGIGMITPLGNSVFETWQNLIAGKSGICRVTRFNLDEYKVPADFPRVAGEVKNFDLQKWGIDQRTAKRMDLFSQYAVAAAKEAILDAGLDMAKANPHHIGIQIGCGLGGLTTWEAQFKILLEKGPDRVSPVFVPMLISNMAPANIAIIFGIKGPNFSIASACASGAHAIGEAFHRIRFGDEVSVMIAGGTEATITPLAFGGFNQMRALSRRNSQPEKASRPFDKDRDGFVMGEGSGILVLEELNHALERNAKIYAEILGYAANCDAHHFTEPSIEGPVDCMKMAISDALINPDEVDYINAHGTATPIGDINETRAIKEVFGGHSQELCVSSTKSMTGHLLGGAGGVEAIITALAIKEGIIPPTINLDTPDPECDLDYVPNTAREITVKIALSNSFGFGGTNACLALKRFGE